MVLRPFSCSVVLCNIKVYIPNQKRPLSLDLTASFPSVKKQSPQEAVIPRLNGLVFFGILAVSKRGRYPTT